MFIVCDISGLSGAEKYWVIGSLWISKSLVPECAKIATAYRIENKIWGEMKWGGITHQKQQEYKNFLTTLLRDSPAEFRGMIIERTLVDLEKFHNGDRNVALAKFVYQCLGYKMSWMIRHDRKTSNNFYILMDNEGWAETNYLDLKSHLQDNLDFAGYGRSIEYLAPVDSKINSLFQVCDIITGAISAVWSQIELSEDRREIVNHVESILGGKLSVPNFLSTSGRLSLWKWRPTSKNC